MACTLLAIIEGGPIDAVVAAIDVLSLLGLCQFSNPNRYICSDDGCSVSLRSAKVVFNVRRFGQTVLAIPHTDPITNR
ncbi:hypothetical protein [Novipirellula aureliae]|uniref:hypothetical protein n=1 Tax=Novipirellula aureliae TaxID=2527966 RepID=UPI0011B53A0F|nr:hypothetical protein [Novipirellula aureliae]